MFGERAIDLREVGDIRNENGGIDNKVESAASGPENHIEIPKYLSDL